MTASNTEILLNLDAEQYPALWKKLYWHKGSYLARLLHIHEYAASKEAAAHITADGKALFFFAVGYMVKIYGGSTETWNACLKFSAAVGMLEIIKPTEKTMLDAMRKSAKAAQGKDRKAILWYYIPPYTPAILDRAESRAAAFAAQGFNTTGMTKTTLIEAFGQDMANHCLIDGRTVSREEKRAEKEIIKAIKGGILQQGYTTKEEVMRQARKQLVKAHKRMSKAEAEGLIVRLWENRGKHLLAVAHAYYHRPNKAEKEHFALRGNGWIITAATPF